MHKRLKTTASRVVKKIIALPKPARHRKAEQHLKERRKAARRGDVNACFDLGIAFSVGCDGVDIDLIEAHKWFNLASLGGHHEAHLCRRDIADEMNRNDIAEAQRQARAWLNKRRVNIAPYNPTPREVAA